MSFYDPEWDKLMTIKKTADQLEKILMDIEKHLQTIAGALEGLEKALLTPDNKVECYADPEEDNEDEWLQYRNE